MSESVKQKYDVCVVGSGAAGGVAAYVLTLAGLSVALLEAGPFVDPSEFKQHMWPYELPRRGLGFGGKGDDLMAPHLYSWIEGEPYTLAEGTEFIWFRGRCLGGRTNHWGRSVARFDPVDFKPFSADSVGDDWPICYEDVVEYYEKVEKTIGVFGPANGSAMPAPKPRCTDRLVQEGCRKLGIPCVTAGGAVLTRPQSGRAACHYCGQCGRGCRSGSNFNSAQVLIPLALETGRLTLLTNSMAREVVVDRNGLSTGVSYVSKKTRTDGRLSCRAVVLAAGACESARLLLNSVSPRFPNGLANSSGAVGKYLRDSVASHGKAYFPQLANVPAHNHDGAGRHLMIPWWKRSHSNDFCRGYRIEFGGGRHMPGVGDFHDVCDEVEGFGTKLKSACRRSYGTVLSFAGFGEMLSNPDSYCDLDHDVMDQWGIPVLKFHFRWGLNEVRMARDIQLNIKSIAESIGGTYLTKVEQTGTRPFGLSVGGDNGHELGTVRMGKDSRTSVLNGFCQSHDVPNLFVVDGGCFTSSPEKPPTLTIMAIAWRSMDYLVNQARNGDL